MSLRYLRIWVDQHNPDRTHIPLAYLIRGQTKKGVTHTLASVQRAPVDPRDAEELRLHADLVAATYRRALVRSLNPPSLAPRKHGK